MIYTLKTVNASGIPFFKIEICHKALSFGRFDYPFGLPFQYNDFVQLQFISNAEQVFLCLSDCCGRETVFQANSIGNQRFTASVSFQAFEGIDKARLFVYSSQSDVIVSALQSPILNLSVWHSDTVRIDYANRTNAKVGKDCAFPAGFALFTRVKAYLQQKGFAESMDQYVDPQGRVVAVKSELRGVVELIVANAPDAIHRVINLALAHEEVYIDGIRYGYEGGYELAELERTNAFKGKAKLFEFGFF
jgi:hypothetical protein